jgi:hypothetical protein
MENETVIMGRVFTTRNSATRWTVVGAIVLLTALGACRKEEQGRELHMDKGVYQGQADTSIGEETVDDLRQRAMQQRAW